MRKSSKADTAPEVERPLGPYVPGWGPDRADLMYIGEAPGFNEEQQRRPFVGKTGVELRRYHNQAKIPVDFDECYLTNVVKHRPFTNKATGNVPPTAKEIARDTPELVQEIETVRPTFIAAVGAVASRWLLGRDVDLESVHGFPFATLNHRAARATDSDDHEGVCGSYCAVGHFIVVPCYHPAYGFHDPDVQRDILDDWMNLGKYMRGELPIESPRDEHPDPDYFEPQHVQLIKTKSVAIDTEGLRGRVWGLSYCQIAGSAGVIRA